MIFRFRFFLLAAILLTSLAASSRAKAETSLLNAAYDVTREFYKEFNPLFVSHWKTKSGETLSINQSHGGSSKQARSVLDGLQADVVTMNQQTDIDVLVKKGLVAPNWRDRLPDHSSPYTSTIVFLVRKGNPKAIKDWDDLIHPGVQVIIPNPKLSGNGRYSYLAAWGYALKKKGSDQAAKDFVKTLFSHVPILDAGGRAASTTFTQRGIGDVLLTFENEAFLLKKELGSDQVEIIVPSVSILADAPVSVVDQVVDQHGTRKQAEAYLQYLWSDEAQELIARNHLRPQNRAILQKHQSEFPAAELLLVDELFGGWSKVQKIHFDDGGVFDQIYEK